MPKTLGWIDTGDRVVISSVENNFTGFGSSSLKDHHLGMHGEVISNNGVGCCQVRLDNGELVSAWNGKNLTYEEDAQ